MYHIGKQSGKKRTTADCHHSANSNTGYVNCLKKQELISGNQNAASSKKNG